MAENQNVDINVNVNVKDGGAKKSVSDLKKEFKELKAALGEATGADFTRLSKQLNDVEGQLADMGDAAKLTAGSGIERLNASFGALKEGMLSADPGKLSLGMKGLGAAMDAIPIFLIIEGLKFLYENFDKVKEIIYSIFPGLDSVSESTKKLEKANKELIETNKIVINNLENEIKILEAQEASESKILAKKKELSNIKIKELEQDIVLQKSKLIDIQQNDDLSESLSKVTAWIQRKLGNDKAADLYEKTAAFEKAERSKEVTDKIKENEIAIANLKTEIRVEEIESNKKQVESAKKTAEDKEKTEKEAYEKRKKLKEQEDAEDKKRIAEYNKFYKDQLDQQIADTNEELEEAKKEQEIADRERKAKNELDFQQGNITRKQYLDEQMAIELTNTNLTENEKLLIKQKYKKEEEKDKELSDKAMLEAELKGIDAARSLTEGFFAWKMRAAKGNAEEELKIKKKQFASDKAFNIARAIQDGIRSVQGALANTATLGPGAIVLAGVNAAIAAGNIAKIAATQFDGGGSASGSVTAPSGGAGGGAGGEQPAQFGGANLERIGGDFNSPNGVKKTTAGQGQEPIKAYVVSQDVTTAQDKSSVIERRASF